MLDHEDLKWIASASTELNAMLQQIARYSDLARQHKGEYNYIDLLGGRVEAASKTAQSLFDRVTSKILAETAGQMGSSSDAPHAPAFTVVPSPDSNGVRSREPIPKPLESKTSSSSSTSVALDSSESSSVPAESKILNPAGNRELILLVEDDVEVAELAAEMLAEEGYKVIIASNGFEALRIYKEIGNQIGLVILDFFLPVMDGDAVFDEFRAINPQINVMLSSGFAEQSKLGAMLALGLRGFIPKPYTREKLLAQVRSTLDAPRQVTH